MQEIYFETYGCTANYNNSEIMKGLMIKSGLNITSNEDYADLIIINSCIVKQPTEEKIRRRILDLLKKNKKIILTGCLPRVYNEKFSHENLFFLDLSQLKNLPKLIYDIQNDLYKKSEYLEKRNEIKLCLPKISKEKIISITQISEGCLGNCTYCVVRLAKGKLFSYPENKILESLKKDLDSGCKEIWLTSQDCSSYGLDKNKYKLPILLKKIINLDKKFILRIGMSNPNYVLKILPELIEIYKSKKIFKFLHIPIQSGSDKILKNMNRDYTKNDILEIISRFKKNFPDIHISTDVIVGYPGETEEDFLETYNLIKEIKPETINTSKFWPRPRTPAAELKQNLSPEEVKIRASEIQKLHKKICIENQKKFLNTEHKVLVDQKGFQGTYLARDENYKLFAVITNKKILGKKLKVKVTKTTPHYLISEVVV